MVRRMHLYQNNTLTPKNIKISLSTILMAAFLSGTSLLCGCVMILLHNNEIYNVLYLLPLCYGIVVFFSLIFIGNCLWESKVTIILLVGYFIKTVLTPILFALGGYKSFYGANVSKNGLTLAVVYMCLETIVIFCLVAYYGKETKKDSSNVIDFKRYDNKIFKVAICCIFLFLVIAYVVVPAIADIYIFLPLADFSEIAEIRWDNETIVSRGSIERYIYTLFRFLWPVFRVIMPSLMIAHFYKKYGMRTSGMIRSFLCLCLPAILIGGDNIAPFIGILIAIIVINKLYGKKARSYIIFGGIIAAVMLWIVVASKISLMSNWKGATGIAAVAQMLHNYFPGFDNFAVIFDMDQENKLTTIFFDLYYTLPFKETLFGLHGKYIQDIFTDYTMTGGQIVPFIGQLTYYMGPFSLIFIGVFVRFAYKMEYRSQNNDNFWGYFICMYISVYTAISLSIYSVSIYIRGMINVVLPVYMIIMLVERKRRSGNGPK